MTPEWNELEKRFPRAAVEHIHGLYDTPGGFSVTSDDLASEAKISGSEAKELLEELVRGGILTHHEYTECGKCATRLDDIEVRDECPECHCSFVDEERKNVERYELRREPPRDVRWVLVLHGMNTRGTWQEELSWLISRSYRRMIPVAIYKYGIIRPGVLFRWRQRMLVRGLAAKIRSLSGQAAGSGYGGKPDVIAHSFGTWMIAHALSSERSIRIGRLILLGCIVRPDFDWNQLVTSGQVGQILNHGASRDIWARIAQFVIPDSGPGGRRGFPPPVVNVMAEGLHHSDYFDPESRMRDLFTRVWQRFLAWETVPPLPDQVAHRSWKALLRPIHFFTRSLVIGVLVLFLALLGCVGVLGVAGLLRRISWWLP